MSKLYFHLRESDGPFKLKYNPKWLCILKSTNHLQRAMPTDKHMPGRGYTADRWDYTPTEDEEKKIHEIFKSGFEVPENFRSTASVFDPQADDRLIGKNHALKKYRTKLVVTSCKLIKTSI